MLAAVVLSFAIAPLAIADVTYEEETKMGGLMKIATFGKGMKSKTFISGDRMRTDDGSEATIIDLQAEKIYTLDTKKKTYTVMTFDEMRQQLESAMAMAEGKRAEAAEGQEAPEVSTSADVRVTETGRSEEIGGFDCKQYLMELDLTMTSEEDQQSGTLSTVTEMWLAKDVPGIDEIQAFHQKMAEKLGTTEIGRQMMSGGQDQSQQFGAGMRKMADEMKKMDGFAMRSVFYFGSPEAAKQEAMGEKPKGGGLGGMLKKMGPFGSGGAGAEEEGQAPGGVMMKITTETKKIETKSIDPETFSVPEGYELRESR